MTTLIAALWLLLAGSGLEVVPLDNPPPEYGLIVNEYGHMQTSDGRWVSAGLGYEGPGHFRLYLPSFTQSMKDSYRWMGNVTYRERVERVAELRAEHLAHELAHGLDVLDDGLLNGSPGHAGYVSEDPYCRTNEAERFACAVVETGRIR